MNKFLGCMSLLLVVPFLIVFGFGAAFLGDVPVMMAGEYEDAVGVFLALGLGSFLSITALLAGMTLILSRPVVFGLATIKLLTLVATILMAILSLASFIDSESLVILLLPAFVILALAFHLVGQLQTRDIPTQQST